MKKLFVGASISWDSLAAALGYLGQPLSYNNWYGNCRLQTKGSALVAGDDQNGNQIIVMGSPHPAIIKKVVDELIKLGCPNTEQVEVVVLELPGQDLIRRLVTMARWPLVGAFVLNWVTKYAARYAQTWWDEGSRMRQQENRG